MISIAIEGLDGSGKTTVAQYVAKELGYQYKNDYLNDMLGIEDEHFFAIKDKLEEYDNARTLLFMASLIYAIESSEKNTIYDRYLLSEYYYDGNEETMKWFISYCNNQKLPDFTIILYASDEVRKERIICRNANDSDLNKIAYGREQYEKMLYCANYFNLNYIIINTDGKSLDEVKEEVMEGISEFLSEQTKIETNEKSNCKKKKHRNNKI